MKTPPSLPARIPRHDLGGTLAKAVPALQVPYIATPTPQAFDLSETITKLQKEAKDGQDEALKETDKIWRETLKDFKLLPADQKVLSDSKDNVMRFMQEKATADPYFLANPSNRMMIQRMVGKVLDGSPLAQMRKRYDLVDDNYKKLSDKKMDAPYLVDGKYSGYTNAEAFRIIQESDGADSEKLLGYQRSNDEQKSLRSLGSFKANQRYGTLEDAVKEVDTASGLIKANSSSTGWATLTPSEQMAQLIGNTGSAMLKNSGSTLNSSNVGKLETLALALAGGWKRNLPEAARQGLEDNFFMAYQKNGGYTKPIETIEGKKANASKEKPLPVADVERMARAGQLKDSEKILEEIERQREAYIDASAQNWVKTRILARSETKSERTQDISLTSDGTSPGSDSAGTYEEDYNFQHMKGLLEYKASTGANAIDPNSPYHMMFTQPTPARQEQFAGWIGKSLASLEAGTDIHLPNKYGPGFKLKTTPQLDLSQFKVVGFNGDGYIMDAAGPEFKALQDRYDKSTDAVEKKALAQQMAGASISQHKNPVTRMTVAAPARAVANSGSTTFSYSKPSTFKGARPDFVENPLNENLLWSGSATDGWDVRSDNPYNMTKSYLSAEQAAKYGFDKAGEYVLFDVVTDYSTNNLLNDARGKGRQSEMNAIKQNQAQQNTQRTAQDASPLR